MKGMDVLSNRTEHRCPFCGAQGEVGELVSSKYMFIIDFASKPDPDDAMVQCKNCKNKFDIDELKDPDDPR